ncbi:50S ribosomal protein L13 [Ignicoccus islandicus DSM 13165]|uniref:Large ribosomal subunit protein eL13 n=1 Tax=Ignicoccus islandicus DSM 13165 TaxID=940295 RepID=A0A0U3FNX2_9CREN|nr:50S ribosomal protein L13e [Ignicoccus islandicus]ALU11671.1 50S ribosomal protein L13 [Ignicoccus islandicus DSM 13165]
MEVPKAEVLTPILRKDAGKKPKRRTGKGFSKGELEAVGLDFKRALKLGLPIDKRRKTVHEWNVEKLRKYLSNITGRKE